MLVTVLNHILDMIMQQKIAKTAHIDNSTQKEAAIKLNLVNEDDFDKWVDPKENDIIMDKHFDITIIGGSFAGMTAALYLANISKDLKIAIIEKNYSLKS